MTDHDTTPGAPETEALAEIILSCWADPSPEPNEIVFAKAIIAAGWISPTEAATRDAAQRAAGAETALREAAEEFRHVHAVMTSPQNVLPYQNAARLLDAMADDQRGAQC